MKPEKIYGVHAIFSLLQNDASRVLKLTAVAQDRNPRALEVVALARQLGIEVQECQRQDIELMFPGSVHQGLVAEYLDAGPRSEKQLKSDLLKWQQPWLVLVLDELQDPHNLGACLRSADAMGVDAVVIPKDNSVGLTVSARKVAAGAASTIPLYRVPNLVRALTLMQEAGGWVYGAAGEAEQELGSVDFRSSSVIVVGQEGSGLRRLTRDACDALFKIPMYGTVESLNVSVATGIALYEASRQRAKPG